MTTLQGGRLREALLVACCLALFVDAACHRGPGINVLFPVSNEAVGWARIGDPRTFQAAELWKYIDGEAERYLKAGVENVSTTDYNFQNKVDAVVDIYGMGNAEDARKIFDSEPTGDAKPIQVGDGARLYSQSLVFRKESYLVRIVAYQESAETPQALLELGRAIERRMTK